MPLGKINFLDDINNDDIFLDALMIFLFLLKNLVNVLAQTMEKTRVANILVNTNLKKSMVHLNQAVVVKKIPVRTLAEAVYTVLSKFKIIKLIKIQLVGLWQKTVVEFEQVD
ncbi:hypothetical protein G9A89_010780 [Geosiphon pyriformis]|nr:hypothetical protein G9A89_010780 [Geosiphon pyriformis]